MIKEFGVMPRRFKEQNKLCKDQPLAWQNFRNGFIAGHVQAVEEYNVLEIIKGLEQMVEAVEKSESDGQYMHMYFDEDYGLEEIKKELKKAKAEWQ